MMDASKPPDPPKVPSSAPRSLRSRLAERVVSRTALALLMIMVASLGAGVAYWIARAEQRTARLHRQLTLGQMVEISLRHRIVSDAGFGRILADRQQAHVAKANSLRTTADSIRAEDARQAEQLDVLAQQERVLARYTADIRDALTELPRDATSATLANLVTVRLVELGLTSRPLPAAATPPPQHEESQPIQLSYEEAVRRTQLPVWRGIADQIEALHHRVPLLALAVVLFVGALVCLTMADLAGSVPFNSNVCLAGGLATALGAIVSALMWDPSVAQPIGFVLAVCAVAGLAVWQFGVLSVATPTGETPHPPELEPRRFWGFDVLIRHAHGSLERIVIGAISGTVLLSSIVGYWYAHAQTHATVAAHHAFASEVALNNLNGERWVLSAAGDVARALDLLSARVRCAFASQGVMLPSAYGSPSALRQAEQERDRECQVLENTEYVTTNVALDRTLQFDSARSPALRMISTAYYKGSPNPAQLYALADGYIGLAERWERKSVIYILGLTLFAIALYLLGQSLGMGGSFPGKVLAVFGSCLALGTFAYAFSVWDEPSAPDVTLSKECAIDTTQLESVKSPDERAIALAAGLYGNGRALYDVAETGIEFENAARALDCVLQVRPDFARALFERANAYSRMAREDADGSYWNLPTKTNLRDVVSSLDRAVAALSASGWSATPQMRNSQGFHMFLTALTTSDPTLLVTARRTFEQGLEAAGIRTSDGQIDAAKFKAASARDRRVYRLLYTNHGLTHLASNDPKLAIQSYTTALVGLHLSEDPQLVASALTDLNILDAYCVQLYKTSPAATPCSATSSNVDTVRRMLLLGRADPDAAVGQARVSQLESWARASRVGWRVTFDVFDPEKDRLSIVWLALAPEWNIWRVVQPLFNPAVEKAFLRSSGRVAVYTLYSDGVSFCLPPGKYRAQFYVNGRLAGEAADKIIDVPAFSDYRSREMNLALCHPADWRLRPPENEKGRTLVREFTTKDDRSAAYLFAFFAPRGAPEETTKTTYRRRAVAMLKRWSGSLAREGQLPLELENFQGCDQPIPPRTMLHKTWTMPDGLVHVAFVDSDFANVQACQVLESIGNYFDRTNAPLVARK